MQSVLTLKRWNAVVCVLALLLLMGVGCRSNPHFSNKTIVGSLNLNGIGPGNTRVGKLNMNEGTISYLPSTLNDKLWDRFLEARRLGTRSAPAVESMEFRLEASGARGTRMIVTTNDIVWLELGVDKPFDMPREKSDTFKVKGLYSLLLTSVLQNSTSY